MSQSLREEFLDKKTAATDARLAPANQYLNELANDLVNRVRQSTPQEGDYSEVINRWWDTQTMTESVVRFEAPALDQITHEEMQTLEGFARLKEVCASPEVDMCLGRPSRFLTPSLKSPARIEIFVERPYADSYEFVKDQSKKAEQALAGKKPNILRRAFSRLKGRRQNAPQVTTKPLTPGPGLN